MKFETLLTFVHRGRIKAHSIVRGPTTHQLWRFAVHVKGLSRQFGLCYSCGSQLATDAAVCPKCNRPQGLPAQPDAFLESPDGEPAPGAPSETSVGSEGAESASVESATAAVPDDGVELHTDDANGEHDIIVPSLQEAPPPPRPPGPRERLLNLRRDRLSPPQRSGALYEEDALDDDADDSYSPPSVGPTFVAPARPMGEPPRRRMWIEAIVFLLVLGAAGVSGLFYVDPHLQAQTQLWLEKGLAAVGIPVGSKPSDARMEPSPDGAMPPIPNPIIPPLPTPNAAAHIPSAPPPVIPSTNPPLEASGSHPSPLASTPAPSSVPPAAVGTAPPITPVDPAPVTPEAPPAAEPAPSDVSTAPADSGDDDPFKRSRALRIRAIDAENSGNYAQAVALFEQIKELPREAWPGDLELRLKAAKANLEGQPRH